MTFLTRCAASQDFEAGLRPVSSTGSQKPASARRVWVALSGFFEDVGILARYAAGLDYYGRDRLGTGR